RELIASLGGDHVIDFSVINGDAHARLPATELAALTSVQSVRVEDGHASLAVAEPHVALPALLDLLKQLNRDLASLTTRHASLEDVFVNLTGRHLRDGESTHYEAFHSAFGLEPRVLPAGSAHPGAFAGVFPPT